MNPTKDSIGNKIISHIIDCEGCQEMILAHMVLKGEMKIPEKT